MESREMEPTKQEIFSVFPEVSRGESTLPSDKSVWLPWQVKNGCILWPNFITHSFTSTKCIIHSDSVFNKKTDNLAFDVEFSIKR